MHPDPLPDTRLALNSLTSSSARPVHHVMLYGDQTGRRYGWATPDEVTTMLAGPATRTAEALAPQLVPRAALGLGDTLMVPAPDDWWFQSAMRDRAGLDPEPPGLHDPAWYHPEITFYTGTHCISWLWSGEVGYPLCVSYGRLRRVKYPRRAVVPWILDSRGFSEVAQHGQWTISPRDYVRDTARYDIRPGGLMWASPQDWMCEEPIIYGGRLGKTECAGTRQYIDPRNRMSHRELIREHQRRTVASFTELAALWSEFSERPCPYIPVLQGDTPDAYLECYQMYHDAGVLLGHDYPLAGVGSVCRLQRTGQIAAVAAELGQLNLELHWFGLKLQGGRRPEIQRDLMTRFCTGGTQSMDSESWSLDARYGERLPGCTHRAQKCQNCHAYATRWRGHVLECLARAGADPARRHRQESLFD